MSTAGRIGRAAIVTESTRWLTVVGVAPEVRFQSLAETQSSIGTFHAPQAQSSQRNREPICANSPDWEIALAWSTDKLAPT